MAAPALAAGAARSRPNTIILFADDLGGHDLGCYGARDLKTPNTDAPAASGAKSPRKEIFWSWGPLSNSPEPALVKELATVTRGVGNPAAQ